MKEVSPGVMTSMHFYGWKQGLKTGMYYLRTRPAADAIKFTVDTAMLNEETNTLKNVTKGVKDIKIGGLVGSNEVKPPALTEEDVGNMTEKQQAVLLCSLQNKDACEMCSG